MRIGNHELEADGTAKKLELSHNDDGGMDLLGYDGKDLWYLARFKGDEIEVYGGQPIGFTIRPWGVVTIPWNKVKGALDAEENQA